MFRISVLFVALLSMTACVSNGTHNELKDKYAGLEKEHQEATNKINELETIIAKLEQDLGQASQNKKSMANSIQHMKDALKAESQRKREIEKRLAAFRKLIQKFKKLTDAGDLSIQIKDGRMVVVLPSDVLFKSGSASLSKKGIETIQIVGAGLAEIGEKQFQIEGHTDNVPIRSQKYPSNWELASARALTVVKIMIKAGMPETRISAASFGETKPVASNDSKEGRKLNRRIDVVVLPDLSQLPGYEELQRLNQ